ncbi:hypothetical protein KRR23_24630 [Pseudomonas sp. CVAP|uniref:hypothetical protein n=1 Tax=Pseudomonas sp. CVAP\|nr:hypothetical protein [Pseudomonas sp. CVAP\
MRVQSSWAVLAFTAFASLAVNAQPLDQRDLIERLTHCTASLQDVVVFNGLVERKELTLTAVSEFEPWGGLAWTIEPALSFGNVSSSVAVMNDHRSFYLRVPSTQPGVDIRTTAQQLQLANTGSGGEANDFRKVMDDRTLQAMSTGEPDNYWVGCFYDQDAVQRQFDLELNATPERMNEKNARQQALGNDS